jgi:two-component system, sensor histidine kinase PdtaS
MADDAVVPPIVADSLALAVVVSSDAPTLLLDGDLTVLAGSSSFARAFGIDPEAIRGKSVFALGAGEWDVPQLRSLLKLTLTGDAGVEAYEMDLKRPELRPRRLVITAHVLVYVDPKNVRLLLAVSDVTEARLAAKLEDDLLREKAVLYQELQHRVANSLQIIASILLLKARTVQSEETRMQLQDAHHRIMSIATVQQQLQASAPGEKIEIGPYLTKLAESLAKSMIGDRRRLSVVVRAAAGTALSDQAVSLGLIVTELVINALKHAFPDRDEGEIVVGYGIDGAGWRLTVSDDGVGRTHDGLKSARTGLGTSIVESLAQQLDCRVEVSSGPQGTTVSIVHEARRDES